MLKVIDSGFYSTLQDAGRTGFRDHGVPISGAMDMYSCQFANTLLSNSIDAAVIEMTMVGGIFQFTKPTYIAISGAAMPLKINDISVKLNVVITVNQGDIITFGRAAEGFRTYLAVKGGFETSVILGSRSQYSSVTPANSLKNGDSLRYNPYTKTLLKQNSIVKYRSSILTSTILETYKGPEFDLLTETQKVLLLNTEFSVSKNNNRMAYQLQPFLKNELQSILTSPVLPGTIQLAPSGQLIVLMRDCQTTGGYPRILQLKENAVNILSQKTTGNLLKISIEH
ncbi:biotin-dependent carboxyltransferase family protein [Winogradskyella sp. PE311]|uniref:5-oxoprolinase subunit C family protein n=1 Tax=Winogradskyella sp. PE311 TaxID=3366943 RepID=UPI0039801DCD